jgi:hypothetical protein
MLSRLDMNEIVARENVREMWAGYKLALENGISEHELKAAWHNIAWFAKQAGMTMREIAGT